MLSRASAPRTRNLALLVSLLSAVVAVMAGVTQTASAGPAVRSASSDPSAALAGHIRHVVVLLKENHSFDSILGPWCAETARCNGIQLGSTVQLARGAHTVLRQATDVVPNVDHEVDAQRVIWNGGRDDGWARVNGCTATAAYRCVTAVAPKQIPNVIRLANAFAVSDATQTCSFVPSWMDHVQWMTACNQDGFVGNNPRATAQSGPGWGCDSGKLTPWAAPGAAPQLVPSCIPGRTVHKSNGGAARATPVPYTRTIAENCDAKPGCTWRTYSSQRSTESSTNRTYMWATNPSFGQLLYGHDSTAPVEQFLSDARAGHLPSLSLVMPSLTRGNDSWHNGASIAFGDQVLGEEVAAVMNGPDWNSTAIFITWDDCGCFYDHISPRRVPLLIVSPYARHGFTDHRPTTFAGIHHFLEEALGLPSLNSDDAGAYDLTDAFDFSQQPLPPVSMVATPVPAASQPYVDFALPAADDDS